MPPRGVKKGTKRARQYEHIKQSEKQQGASESGQRSGRGGPRGRTRDQLYNEARLLNIEGRSNMSKSQLQKAVDGKKS